MSERIQRIRVAVTVTTEFGNDHAATIESADYESVNAFKDRVGIVIDNRVHRAGGEFVRPTGEQ
jgi:hypothetical protein